MGSRRCGRQRGGLWGDDFESFRRKDCSRTELKIHVINFFEYISKKHMHILKCLIYVLLECIHMYIVICCLATREGQAAAGVAESSLDPQLWRNQRAELLPRSCNL